MKLRNSSLETHYRRSKMPWLARQCNVMNNIYFCPWKRLNPEWKTGRTLNQSAADVAEDAASWTSAAGSSGTSLSEAPSTKHWTPPRRLFVEEDPETLRDQPPRWSRCFVFAVAVFDAAVDVAAVFDAAAVEDGILFFEDSACMANPSDANP